MTPAKGIDGRLAAIRHVALDLDGTIYRGTTLFPFTLPFLARLRELGIGHTFLTNNPSKSVDDYLAHLRRFGIEATAGELLTTTAATIAELRARHPQARRLFILGTPSMIAEFAAAGFTSTRDDPDDEPDALVVGFDTMLAFPRLGRAAWWAGRGKPYLATNPDRVCPTDQRTILVDCGSVCACIEHATGRRPDVVLGKPDPRMLGQILSRHQLQPHQVAMAGDRIYTDMLMARRAGALGVLVLSGECTAPDAETADPAPDLVVPSIAEFGELLAAQHNPSRTR
jgi:HAD superfamily hydrolase (TIGR01450 family)